MIKINRKIANFKFLSFVISKYIKNKFLKTIN